MQVSPDQLLQFIGGLYVENQLLNQKIDAQQQAIKDHMKSEHTPAPDPKETPSDGNA